MGRSTPAHAWLAHLVRRVPRAPDPLAGLDLMPIGAIQGRGDTSPYLDQTVTFTGIVTGWYEDRNTAGFTFYTLFLQDVPEQVDGDPATSDAIPIFLAETRPGVALGDQLVVTGTVIEFWLMFSTSDRVK